MDCPNCGQANRAQANYCRFCGTHFALACPRCRSILLDDSAFCDNCGLPLGSAAPAAPLANARLAPGSQPPPTPPAPRPQTAQTQLHQYIPPELMQKLETARARGEMVGERRIVTMLFCDVKGSTAAAEQLDPEDYSEIMNGAFTHMIRPVYRYEGTLARLMGDALLAFFGAPISHEDDPQRAVLAGLDIVSGIRDYREEVRQRWGLAFDVRVGINTGLVVVGAVGSDLRMEYSALGDAINLAARMEQTAAPGTVQIAHDTYKAVRHLFEFENLGDIEIKGKSEPVPAYRVLRRKAVGGLARGIEGLHAEMVGRAAELQAMGEVVADLRQGVGRIVFVLGEAGLGKSRLVTETRKLFDAAPAPEARAWHEAGSLSYETSQAYGLFQRLIRRVQGIDYNDPLPLVREKLASLIAGLPMAERERAGRVFGALFGLAGESSGAPLEGDAFRRELHAAMEAWWRARFADTPTVLVFEDMHWGDAASMALLRQLLPLTGEMALVLLCVMRSERQAPAWQIKTTADDDHHHRYLELSLRPLSEAESNELVNRLLAVAELPDRLCASILEKTGGNPFFIEEVVRALIDSGAVVPEDRPVLGGTRRYWTATRAGADFEIPGSLQALLSARMDRLEEATRGTLQLASVIGRSFYHRLLRAVDDAAPQLDQHLGTLLRLDMIREAARVPELEYVFRNPLTQEAVYNTILLKRRRTFHRRVGEAMELLYAERRDGLLGLLAHHFRLAGLAEKAVDYSRQAARQAVALFAYDDAVRNLRAALELVEPSHEHTETHMVLREELADVYRLLRDGGGAIDQYQQALELWRGLADADKLVAVRLHRKIVQVITDLKWSVSLEELQQANAHRLASRAMLEEALPFLQAEPPHLETVRALVALSTDAWRIQDPPDWETAQRFAQAAADMAAQIDSPVDQSQALGALATVLDGRSLLREHQQVTQQRLELCRSPRFDVHESIEAIRSAGAAFMYVGEYEQALRGLREAEALAVRAQIIDQQANALGLQAQCYFRLDRWDEVLATEAKWRALEHHYPRERVGELCFYVALSASVHALRGDEQRAAAYAKESYDFMLYVSGSPDNWQRNQFY